MKMEKMRCWSFSRVRERCPFSSGWTFLAQQSGKMRSLSSSRVRERCPFSSGWNLAQQEAFEDLL